MCNVRPEDGTSAEELRTRVKLSSIKKCLQDRKLQLSRHLHVQS